jgi:hypothetical protein
MSDKTPWEVLSHIVVNDNTEKKGKFTYLSWAWAWAELMKKYPLSTYELHPDTVYPDETMEVRVSVTVNETTHMMWLPVMGNRNDAIKNPDAMLINKARMRCLVKCIGMHGIGLYIYAGEDLPEEGEPEPLLPTDAEKVKFKTYMDDEDALRFFLFIKSIEEEVYVSLYNSAPTAKMKFKEKCDGLEKDGQIAAKELVATVVELLGNGDAAWQEELEGLEKGEKSVLWSMFSQETKDAMMSFKGGE